MMMMMMFEEPDIDAVHLGLESVELDPESGLCRA
jgi:hypothetical protein